MKTVAKPSLPARSTAGKLEPSQRSSAGKSKRPAGSSAGRPQSKRPPGPARKTDSAALLLAAASDLLSERRSLDISLSDIADRSGLNSALIKYYFGNKEGLLLELLRRDAAHAMMQLQYLVDLNVAPDQKMRMHITGIINTYRRYPYLNGLIHLLLGDGDSPAAAEIADFFVKPLVHAQQLILDEGLKAGVFRPVDTEMFYFSLLGACDLFFFASYTHRHVFGDMEVTDELKRRYITHITDVYMSALVISPEQRDTPSPSQHVAG
jgi:TetR/AcrR family transcriptional regulator